MVKASQDVEICYVCSSSLKEREDLLHTCSFLRLHLLTGVSTNVVKCIQIYVKLYKEIYKEALHTCPTKDITLENVDEAKPEKDVEIDASSHASKTPESEGTFSQVAT